MVVGLDSDGDAVAAVGRGRTGRQIGPGAGVTRSLVIFNFDLVIPNAGQVTYALCCSFYAVTITIIWNPAVA